MMSLGFGMGINEPAHVPSRRPDHDGWLLAVVDRQVAEDRFESELWVIEAGAIAKGPIARVPMPLPMRSQVHGTWVPAAQLEEARANRKEGTARHRR